MIQIIFYIIALANIQAYEILKPALPEIKDPIVAYIQEHAAQFQEAFTFGVCDNLDMYIIDINNDGQDEYIFLDYSGTANALTLIVLAKANDEIKEIRFPNTFNYFHEFKHPITHECQLFVRADGVNYICFSNGTYDRNLDVYCWKNGIVSYCASPFWIKQQMAIFDELCVAQDYRTAYIFLNDFEKICKDSLDVQTDLHILSKIAYAALHNNWLNQCMALLTKIKSNKNYQSLSTFVKTEISSLESLCQKKLIEEKGGKSSNVFKWILSYENKPSGALIADRRFHLLLSSIAPDLLEYNFLGFKETPENINRYFYWPNSHVDKAENKVSVMEERYAVFSGRYPHCATNRGFVWCDTKKSVGALVLVEESSRGKEWKVYIASRQLNADDLPMVFLASLNKWLNDNEIEAKQAKFCDRDGIIHYMNL